MIVIWNFSKL